MLLLWEFQALGWGKVLGLEQGHPCGSFRSTMWLGRFQGEPWGSDNERPGGLQCHLSSHVPRRVAGTANRILLSHCKGTV